jgi:hypothetical protein
MRERNLPLKPVWGGFAVNSAAYGGGSWLALLLIQRWRRAAREKRGLCAVCGYPAGASSVCTECGKPVKARAVPAEAIAIAQPRL